MSGWLMNFTQTTKHKAWVLWYVLKACRVLLWRGLIHDLSKYGDREAPYFELTLPILKDLEYNSPGYHAAIAQLGPALAHHYGANSHHPEHYGGIEYMSSLDLIEMLCDWKAAGKRHRTGNMRQSFKANRTRFDIDDLLYDSLVRDAKEIGL